MYYLSSLVRICPWTEGSRTPIREPRMALCLAFRLLLATTMVRMRSRVRASPSAFLPQAHRWFDTIFVHGCPPLSARRGRRIISTGVKYDALPQGGASLRSPHGKQEVPGSRPGVGLAGMPLQQTLLGGCWRSTSVRRCGWHVSRGRPVEHRDQCRAAAAAFAKIGEAGREPLALAGRLGGAVGVVCSRYTSRSFLTDSQNPRAGGCA